VVSIDGARRLLELGAASADGVLGQFVAERAAQEAETQQQARVDRRNALRRQRRAARKAGAGTRPAQATAPPAAVPATAPVVPVADPDAPDAQGLVWCSSCQRRVLPIVRALHRGDQRAATVEAFAARRAELGIGGAGEFNPMTARW